MWRALLYVSYGGRVLEHNSGEVAPSMESTIGAPSTGSSGNADGNGNENQVKDTRQKKTVITSSPHEVFYWSYDSV